LLRPTEEAEDGTKKGTRLECRRDIARDAVGIRWRNVKVPLEAGASNRRPDKGAIIAKAGPEAQNKHLSSFFGAQSTYSREPVAMMAVSRYNRQLYTSFGVGLSSTARNPPMMDIASSRPFCSATETKFVRLSVSRPSAN
jgi:hypothetical protein